MSSAEGQLSPPLGKGRPGGVPAINPPLTKGRSGGVITKAFNKTDQKMKRKALRGNMPLAEVILWSKLKRKQLEGHRFRRQYSIDTFVLDFYSPELKLAIEVDGDSHYTDDAHLADRERQIYIEAFGIQFLRFTNREIYENLEGVLSEIAKRIKKLTSPPPPSQGGD